MFSIVKIIGTLKTFKDISVSIPILFLQSMLNLYFVVSEVFRNVDTWP